MNELIHLNCYTTPLLRHLRLCPDCTCETLVEKPQEPRGKGASGTLEDGMDDRVQPAASSQGTDTSAVQYSIPKMQAPLASCSKCLFQF